MYQKLNSKLLNQLREVVGEQHLLTRKEQMEDYSHDENPSFFTRPEAVAKPASAGEISRLLLLANRENFPVVVRGGGTGVTGGAIPLFGGLVVSLERMNHILEIDEENMMAVVEPGLNTGELHKAVEAKGRYYPPNPTSLENCTLGANLADDASGPLSIK